MKNNVNITTPILFMVFNRPEKTQIVFDSIRKVRPTRLYIAVDAPREGRADDLENCNKVKAIVHNVDWPCEVHYLEHEKNLGCTKAGIIAWRWFFEHEDRMIFIEDDGYGNESAFYFVEEMLERYKNDNRIAYVGTVNYGPKYGNATYFFSRYPAATYFMGTWKRVMDLYDYDLNTYSETVKREDYKQSFISKVEKIIMTQQFELYIRQLKKGIRQNTYDLQMEYLSYKYNMCSIYPNINMTSNIGLDGGANNKCNTTDSFYLEYGNRPRYEIESIDHPVEVKIDKNFELLFFKKRVLFNKWWFPRWLRLKIKTILGQY